MNNFFKKHHFSASLLSIIISVFLVSLTAYGATTIGTNITTGGTLDVTGNTALTQASTTLDFWLGNLVADDDDYLYMDASSSEWIMWDDSPGEFDVSDDLNVGGVVTSTGSWVGAGGNATNVNMTNDLFVQDSVEIDGGLWADSATTTDTTSIGSGVSIREINFGTCDIDDVAVTASSTAYTDCLNATGAESGDKVFVTPTSSLPAQFVVQAASSTANDSINIRVYNLGYSGSVQTGGHTFYWYSIR